MTKDYVGEALRAYEQDVTAPSALEFRRNESGSTNGGGKPLLAIDPGNLPAVAVQLRDIMAQSGALYNRGGPVRIRQSSSDAAPTASPVTTHGVVRLAHEHSRPVKDGAPCTLPDRVARP